jgi:hypothetical protein
MALLEATSTNDIEQVNGFGVYSKGRDAVFAAAQKAVGANKRQDRDIATAQMRWKDYKKRKSQET